VRRCARAPSASGRVAQARSTMARSSSPSTTVGAAPRAPRRPTRLPAPAEVVQVERGHLAGEPRPERRPPGLDAPDLHWPAMVGHVEEIEIEQLVDDDGLGGASLAARGAALAEDRMELALGFYLVVGAGAGGTRMPTAPTALIQRPNTNARVFTTRPSRCLAPRLLHFTTSLPDRARLASLAAHAASPRHPRGIRGRIGMGTPATFPC
jgi:hypothetical protein